MALNPAKSRTNRRTQILGLSPPAPSRGSLSFHSFVSSRSLVCTNACTCVSARVRVRNYLYPPRCSWLQMAAVAIAAETAESHRRTTTQRGCTTPMCALFVDESYTTRRTLCSGGVDGEKDEGTRLYRARRSVSSAATPAPHGLRL